MSLRRTPALLAGLLDVVDRPDRRITTHRALTMILGIYLLFFAAGGVSGVMGYFRGAGGDLNYLEASWWPELALYIGEIAGALVIFWVLAQWLWIPRAIAGIPRSRRIRIDQGRWLVARPPLPPALLTILVVLLAGLAADQVLTQLEPGVAVTNGTDVVNWALPIGTLIRATNAGVVEEIVIVAIPVLLGRKASWNPWWIIALSVPLRWPYHIYHGLWTTVPWVLIWGTAHVAAFLYWRRLWPIVAFHIWHDCIGTTVTLFGVDTATLVMTGGAATLMAIAMARHYRQTRRLSPAPLADHHNAVSLLPPRIRRNRRITGFIAPTVLGLGCIALIVAATSASVPYKVIISATIAVLAVGASAAYLYAFGSVSVAQLTTGPVLYQPLYTGNMNLAHVPADTSLAELRAATRGHGPHSSSGVFSVYPGKTGRFTRDLAADGHPRRNQHRSRPPRTPQQPMSDLAARVPSPRGEPEEGKEQADG